MKIARIEVENFRCYCGSHVIELSTDDTKSITLIEGETGAGKSTIVDALLWCFYKELVDNSKSLLSQGLVESSSDNDRWNTRVAVSIIREDFIYKISRVYLFKVYKGKAEKLNEEFSAIATPIAGGPAKNESPEELVRSIMPKQTIKHFFFKGENLEQLGDVNTNAVQRETAEAIQQILGLDIIKKSIELFKGTRGSRGVITEFRNQLHGNDDSELEAVQKSITEIEVAISNLEESKKELEEELRANKDELRKTEETIMKNSQAKMINEAIKLNEEEISGNRNDELNEYKLTIKELSKQVPQYLLNRLGSKAVDRLDSFGDLHEGIPKMNQDSIDYLIQRGKCICGEELSTKHQERLRTILAEKELLPPAYIGNVIAEYKANVTHTFDIDLQETIRVSHRKIIESERLIERKNEENQNKREELQGFSDITFALQQKGEITQKIKDITKRIDELEAQLEQGRLSVAEKKDHEEIIAKKNASNEKTLKYINYCTEILKRLEGYLEDKIGSITLDLNRRIQIAFKEMYKDAAGLETELDREFHLSVFRETGNGRTVLEMNEGQKIVLSIAYIIGVIQIAKEKIEDLSMINETYPLIMDAPFSKIDTNHIEKVSRYISSIAGQWVVLMNEKDKRVCYKYIEGKIGEEYLLKHENTIQTSLKKIEVQ